MQRTGVTQQCLMKMYDDHLSRKCSELNATWLISTLLLQFEITFDVINFNSDLDRFGGIAFTAKADQGGMTLPFFFFFPFRAKKKGNLLWRLPRRYIVSRTCTFSAGKNIFPK